MKPSDALVEEAKAYCDWSDYDCVVMADFAQSQLEAQRREIADEIDAEMIGDFSDYQTLSDRLERYIDKLRSPALPDPVDEIVAPTGEQE